MLPASLLCPSQSLSSDCSLKSPPSTSAHFSLQLLQCASLSLRCSPCHRITRFLSWLLLLLLFPAGFVALIPAISRRNSSCPDYKILVLHPSLVWWMFTNWQNILAVNTLVLFLPAVPICSQDNPPVLWPSLLCPTLPQSLLLRDTPSFSESLHCLIVTMS